MLPDRGPRTVRRVLAEAGWLAAHLAPALTLTAWWWQQ